MTRAGRLLWGPLLAGVLPLLAAGPAAAQVFRFEDADGVVYYTNNPCDPRYVRLAPGACPPERPAPGAPAAAPVTAAVAPASEGGDAVTFTREIESTAARYGVDRRLVEAVIRVESAGNPRAVSPKGALGLMQLMPSRAAALGVAQPFDPAANLDGGVRHLRDLLGRYAGNLQLALAAYNAGEEAVRVHGGVPPYRETREYVRKVLALYGTAGRDAAPVKPASGKPARASRL
jgi:soluble lytic murein transglycosylase-like protein